MRTPEATPPAETSGPEAAGEPRGRSLFMDSAEHRTEEPSPERRPTAADIIRDEDLFFPVADCRREQELVPGSELRVISSVSGHLGLFALEPAFMEQVDRHLGELLAS